MKRGVALFYINFLILRVLNKKENGNESNRTKKNTSNVYNIFVDNTANSSSTSK